MRWTDSDNLRATEAVVVGGHLDGMRIAVNEKSGQYRWPDVLDLSAYEFDAESWCFLEIGSTGGTREAGGPDG